MLQELFRIPGTNIPVYGYGAMLVIGFLLATQLAKFLARHEKLNPEIFVNASLIALFAGVIGARLSHVLENLSDYTRPELGIWGNFINAINIRSGGLTYYGGFILAFLAVLLYGIWKKVPIRVGMDILAPCILIGLGFGRVGCFMNGCCYGAETNVPWAVRFPYYSNAYVEQFQKGEISPPPALTFIDPQGRGIDLIPPKAMQNHPALQELARHQQSLPVHPAQLYSTFTALLLATLLLAFYTLPHRPGQVFALMLLLEPITRFLLEMLRAEPAVLGSMSFSMALSIPLETLGIVLWIWFSRTNMPSEKIAAKN